MKTLAPFQMLKSHMGLVATISGSTDIEHFHYCGKFNWTVYSRGYQTQRRYFIHNCCFLLPSFQSTFIPRAWLKDYLYGKVGMPFDSLLDKTVSLYGVLTWLKATKHGDCWKIGECAKERIYRPLVTMHMYIPNVCVRGFDSNLVTHLSRGNNDSRNEAESTTTKPNNLVRITVKYSCFKRDVKSLRGLMRTRLWPSWCFI